MDEIARYNIARWQVLAQANALFTRPYLNLDVASARWSRVAGGDTYKNPSTGQCDFPSDFTAIDKAVPERRSAFAFGPRADGRGFLAAFGKSDCGVVADAWWWSSGPSAWKALRENPVGLSCERVSTTCKSLCN